jgi:hypothetical protein
MFSMPFLSRLVVAKLWVQKERCKLGIDLSFVLIDNYNSA